MGQHDMLGLAVERTPEIAADGRVGKMSVSAHQSFLGCVATFKNQQESDWLDRPGSVSRGHREQMVDELNLLPNIGIAHSPCLTLPDHVDGFVSLDRSPRRGEFTKALLGLHASFDRSMILLQDVVQVLYRLVVATASQDSFLLHS